MNEQNNNVDEVSDQKDVKKSSVGKKASFIKTRNGRIIVVVLGVVVLFGALTQRVYSMPASSSFVRLVAQVVPYPALKLNGETLTMKEFFVEYDALAQYFSSQESVEVPPDDILEAAIADTLVNKLAIVQLAEKFEVEIDQDQVEIYYQDLVVTQGSEEVFEQSLDETYGWTINEFKTRIIESIVLALQMTEVVLKDVDLQAERIELIESAATRVAQGEEFVAVAKEVHSGFEGLESDLGYVNLDIMPNTWADIVEQLEIDEVSSIIGLDEGYVLFQALDRVVDGDETKIHLLSITVPKITLEDIVSEFVSESEVTRYIGK
jgi:parvulin-like peptidyl-prolyl isomerase